LRLSRITLTLIVTLALALPAGGSAEEPSVRVQVHTVTTASIGEAVRLNGTVTAARASRLSPATSGLIVTLDVDAGSRVTTGQVLLGLDPELARLQAESAEATARAASVALEDSRRRLGEARALVPQRSIAETVVHDLAAEVAQDEAALQQAEADAGYRRALLARHELRAPYDGVIAAKHSEVGEWVVPGDAVLDLVATGDLRIDFPVAEAYIHRVRPGDAVTFTSDAAGGEPHTGTVAAVVPVSDPGARTFLLRVDPGASGAKLSPGLSVHGELQLDAGHRAPVVPRDAIIRHPDGRVIVWAVEPGDAGSVVTERLVDPGLAFDGLVEIRSGLDAGASVVIKGNEALVAGQTVTVLETDPD